MTRRFARARFLCRLVRRILHLARDRPMSLDRGAPSSGRFSQAGQRVVERSAEPLRCRPVTTTRRRMTGGLPRAQLVDELAGFVDPQFVGRVDTVAML